MSGLDRLSSLSPLPYDRARVGLCCHRASITADGVHAVDVVLRHTTWELACLFTPEHGFAGDAAAGENVPHDVHPGTGVPMYSLYGETRTPDPEWLKGLDLVVTDLQDLGVRCYTYASTLMEVLKACARAEVPVLVLDRTIPLAGIVDGPGLDPNLSSFVGQVPLPLVYGLGQGPLAEKLRTHLPELWSLELTVLPAIRTPPSWCPPSPAIVSPLSALCYPVTVWSEAIPRMWVDRGGPRSFQVWAMPEFPVDAVVSLRLPGLRALPGEYDTPDGCWPGVRFEITDRNALRPVTAAHLILKQLCETLGPDTLFHAPDSRPGFFDQLAGTHDWRDALVQGRSPEFHGAF